MGVDKRDSSQIWGEREWGKKNMKSRNKSFSGIQEMGKREWRKVEKLNLKSWKSGERKNLAEKGNLEREKN